MNSGNFFKFGSVLLLLGAWGCAHSKVDEVPPEKAARIERKLVKDAVVFEPGTEQGAVVPELSAPRLRAHWIDEHVEGNTLYERCRAWSLEGDVSILGFPAKGGSK